MDFDEVSSFDASYELIAWAMELENEASNVAVDGWDDALPVGPSGVRRTVRGELSAAALALSAALDAAEGGGELTPEERAGLAAALRWWRPWVADEVVRGASARVAAALVLAARAGWSRADVQAAGWPSDDDDLLCPPRKERRACPKAVEPPEGWWSGQIERVRECGTSRLWVSDGRRTAPGPVVRCRSRWCRVCGPAGLRRALRRWDYMPQPPPGAGLVFLTLTAPPELHCVSGVAEFRRRVGRFVGSMSGVDARSAAARNRRGWVSGNPFIGGTVVIEHTSGKGGGLNPHAHILMHSRNVVWGLSSVELSKLDSPEVSDIGFRGELRRAGLGEVFSWQGVKDSEATEKYVSKSVQLYMSKSSGTDDASVAWAFKGTRRVEFFGSLRAVSISRCSDFRPGGVGEVALEPWGPMTDERVAVDVAALARAGYAVR